MNLFTINKLISEHLVPFSFYLASIVTFSLSFSLSLSASLSLSLCFSIASFDIWSNCRAKTWGQTDESHCGQKTAAKAISFTWRTWRCRWPLNVIRCEPLLVQSSTGSAQHVTERNIGDERFIRNCGTLATSVPSVEYLTFCKLIRANQSLFLIIAAIRCNGRFTGHNFSVN